MLDRAKVRQRMAVNGFRYQRELAKAMGVKDCNLSLWMGNSSHRRVPDLTTVVKMAKVLNCKVDDLLIKDA